MRKRRRLANKMTIMVCAVLCAVSAFFYTPMEVEAGVSSTVSSFSSDLYYKFDLRDPNRIYLKDYLDSDVGYYLLSMDITVNYDSNVDVWLNNFFACFNSCGFYEQMSFSSSNWETSHTFTERRYFYIDASYTRDSTVFDVYYKFVTALRSSSPITVNCSYSVSNVIVQEITSVDYDSYTQGYNAGYSDGESAGYGNGYSQGFTDGEASVDTDAIYDEAFQAGKDSVDTQSYYDAGYQAGYQVAYSEGYESGYDVGYQSAMDRIANWGADTSDYPLLISESGETFDLQFDFIEEGSDEAVYSDYSDSERFYTGIDFNPNHTYRLDFTYHNFSYEYDSFFTSSFSFWLYWGDSSFPLIVGSKDDITTSVFIPGDRISNGLRFRCDLGQIESNGSIDVLHYYLKGCYLKLYDMGPSGDTQNHIANQTDQLTNGFDESQGNSVNSDLSSGLNEYQTAEDSLWATATIGLKDFTFFDFESVPAMITGMSFITSIMGSWFSYAGGASGVGIVLSILFSVMLVAMVLGLYRLYQSKGGKK